eukprot:GHVS01012012.1.p1 GENE.GHVS01012012.1~~GHVS01012012.1.p1  ORF type:complete len:211 (+),score=37.25 GHVS01012012.1:19-651(+)
MTWTEHSVNVDIAGPIDLVFFLYHNVAEHPHWSPWLLRVDWIDYRQQISKWAVKKFGVTISFTAVNYTVLPPRLLCWRSLDGAVQQYGRAEFACLGENNNTRLSVKVKYKLPRMVGAMFQSSWLSKQVEQVLRADIEKFEVYVQDKMKQSCMDLRLVFTDITHDEETVVCTDRNSCTFDSTGKSQQTCCAGIATLSVCLVGEGGGALHDL